MAVVISGAIFQPLIGKLISFHSVGNANHYSVHDFKYGLSIIFFAYVISFIVALFFIKETNIYSYKSLSNDYLCNKAA